MMGSVSHHVAFESARRREGELPKSSKRRAPARSVKRATKQVLHRDEAMARRMEIACDGHPHIPEFNHGRLSWIIDQLEKRFGLPVSMETARKWYAGLARPRPDKMSKLAQLFEVDEAWLAIGTKPDMQPQERKAHNVMAGGAVNLVAGVIQLGGGHPAFPPPGSELEKEGVDITAIIKGGQFFFNVSLAHEAGKGVLSFKIPNGFANMIVIGVVPKGLGSHDFLQFDPESLGRLAERKGGFHELRVSEKSGTYCTGSHKWARGIPSLGER